MTREEHGLVVNKLLAGVSTAAQELDGLVNPDQATLDIMRKCIGVGFAFGRAFEHTNQEFPIDQRWADTLTLIAGSNEISPDESDF